MHSERTRTDYAEQARRTELAIDNWLADVSDELLTSYADSVDHLTADPILAAAARAGFAAAMARRCGFRTEPR